MDLILLITITITTTTRPRMLYAKTHAIINANAHAILLVSYLSISSFTF